MKKLKFKVLSVKEISEMLHTDLLNLPFIKNYMADKPEIFDRVDIFCNNSRSKKQAYHRFDLLQEVTKIDMDTVLVCPLYLELFIYTKTQSLIAPLIEGLTEKYSGNRIVFQWNHDEDFALNYSWVSKFPNVYIIQFNTSKRIENDIVVPFWNLNTTLYNEKKSHFAGFIGQLNHVTRYHLFKTLKDKPNYHIINTGTGRAYGEETFLKLISSFSFNFCPRGAGLSSYRFFETLHVSSVPVLLADKVELPFTDVIDYSKICVKFPEGMSTDFNRIDNELNNVDWASLIRGIDGCRYKFSLHGIHVELYKRLVGHTI